MGPSVQSKSVESVFLGVKTNSRQRNVSLWCKHNFDVLFFPCSERFQGKLVWVRDFISWWGERLLMRHRIIGIGRKGECSNFPPWNFESKNVAFSFHFLSLFVIIGRGKTRFWFMSVFLFTRQVDLLWTLGCVPFPGLGASISHLRLSGSILASSFTDRGREKIENGKWVEHDFKSKIFSLARGFHWVH